LFKILDGRSEFYQWDLDRQLIIEDATVNEVHFCNRTDDCSLVCEVYELDGLRVANVPNILLQDNWRINVYAYDSNYTKFCEQFDVLKRSKPADYVYTETEIKNYDELAARVDEIEKNGISEEAVSGAIEKYLEENDIRVDLTGYATETYVNEKIEQIELTPGPAGPQGEPGKDGAQGPAGKDGKDGAPGKDGAQGPIGPEGPAGKDYVLTQADKKEIAGMVEVSGDGTDLTNYYTKDEVDAAIEKIELTPGPAGEQGPQGEPGPKGEDGAPGADGKDGEDYVLTEEDKAEIAGMVPGADVDLTNYYTKTEIDNLQYQTEAQVINLIGKYAGGGENLPAAEEVEF
jgi:hypothetical protein